MKLDKVELDIEGMSCISCANRIEKTLRELRGIKEANVNFSTKKAKIIYDLNEITLQEIINRITKIGYKLKEKHLNESVIHKNKLKIILSSFLTFLMMILMLISMFYHNIKFMLYLQFTEIFISFVVIFIIGFSVIKNTILSIKSLSFNMDSLIGIGTIASFSTGILNFFNIEVENFSLVGAMIMSINLIGNYLKENATEKTSYAIKQLLELSAKNAHRLNHNGIEEDIPIEHVKVGDILLVKPGEKIPIDGIIIEGETTVNESILTGESMPVYKKINDNAFGGTINQYGAIKLKVTKTFENTFLSQIVRLVKEAQSSKVPIQQFADKVTSKFVPFILILSLLSFLFWYLFPEAARSIYLLVSKFLPWLIKDISTFSMAIFSAIATLVIACPCALGLATPTALIVGIGKSALNGILIRKADAIQIAKDINLVLFDKTGTITKGYPVVKEIFSIIEKNEFITMVASVESFSEHPLAKAVVDYAKKIGIEFKNVDNFKAVSGRGVIARIQDKEIIVGSKFLFYELKIELDKLKEKIDEFENKGYTVIIVMFDSELSGIIGIRDEIKDDAKKSIENLHKLGIKTAMLTGDNKKVAFSIAKEVNIDEVYAELLPDDKIKIVKDLQKKGYKIAMVGDGINDAPALTQADLGIAIGTGTEVAIESADIIITKGNLIEIPKAILLSKATFKKIKQNLFWAFFYNIIAIPFAFIGILHPVVAEIAMAFSSINVVLNSLRLKKLKIDIF